MAADEFKKLSPEQLQKLSRTINDAKALTNQQAEIIEDVIAGEIDIGKLRISYLKEYFDAYSKSLDLVARKHSALNDAFLVLDGKINESFKKVVAEGTKAVADLVNAAEKAASATSKPQTTKQEESHASDSDEKQKTDKSTSSKEPTKPDASLTKAIVSLREEQSKQHSEYTGKIADLLTSIANLELTRHQLGRNEISSVTDLLVSKFQEAATGIASSKASIVEQRDLTKVPVDQAEPLSPVIKSLSDLLHASVSALASISEIAGQASNGLTKYGTSGISDNGGNNGGNNSGNNSNSNNTPGGNPPQNIKPYNTVEDDTRKKAREEDLDLTDKLVGGIFTTLKLGNEESIKAATEIAAQFGSIGELTDYYRDQEADQIAALAQQRKATAAQLMDLDIARRNDEADQIRQLTELQLKLSSIQKTAATETTAQQSLNNANAIREFTKTEDGSTLLLKQEAALELQKDIAILEELRINEIAKKRLEKEIETGRKITEAELANVVAEANKAYSLDAENLARVAKLREALGDAYFEKQKNYQNTLIALERANHQDKATAEARAQSIRLAHQAALAEAELKARQELNNTKTERGLAKKVDVVNLQLQQEAAIELQNSIKTLEEQRLKEIEKKRLEKELETGHKVTAAELASITKEANKKFALNKKNLAEIAKQREILGDKYFEEQKNYQNILIALDKENRQDAIAAEARLLTVKLANQKKLAAAQLQAQQLLNDIEATRKYEATIEGIDNADKTANEIERQKAIQQLEAKRTKWIATEELRLKRTNGRELTLEERQKIREEAATAFSLEQENLKKHAELRKKLGDEYFANEDKLADINYALEKARVQDRIAVEAHMLEVILNKRLEASEAELKAQELKNAIDAEMQAASQQSDELGMLRAQAVTAQANEKALHELKKRLDMERAELEYQIRRDNNGELSEAQAAAIEQQLVEKYGSEEAQEKRLAEIRKKQFEAELKAQKDAIKAAQKQTDQTVANALSFSGFDKYNSIADRLASLNELRDTAVDERNGELSRTQASLLVAVKALSSLAQQLDSKIDEIALSKGTVDTRLQGSSNKTRGGSYWDQIVKDMTKVGAVNPYFKQETFANNIKELVNRGIAFDLEQRAFLMTIQEKIANTFNVADGTLLRLIRIQQEDSTAGRLGMEASLNAFLNEMYETTEYLSDVAAGVRSSLEEMEALMSGAEATEVEYQIQKWMGSLYSVGMSQNAVTSISQALGQIAAGEIDGLTSGGAGNLLVMAANDAGLSIADVMTKGLDASDTNKLMQAVVNYLAEIADASKDNNVVQQQLANVFGVKASDLRAATNLAVEESVSAIYGKTMSYDNMLRYLTNMAGSMGSRTSMGEVMTNIWNNVQYTMAGSMASNPVSYFLYKSATLLDDSVGGISIPIPYIMGNTVDLQTTVADLMRVASLGTGILGSIGSLVQGLGNSFSGRAMLEQLGIGSGSGLTATPRGGGNSGNVGAAGGTVSESGHFAGNTSSSDVLNSTMQGAQDTRKQQMIEAQEEADANQVDSLNTTVLKIYELLDDVVHGSGCMRVKVEGYGLTRAGNSGNSLGGVAALGGSSNSYGNSSSSSTAILSNSSSSSSVISGSLDFGGWTTALT